MMPTVGTEKAAERIVGLTWSLIESQMTRQQGLRAMGLSQSGRLLSIRSRHRESWGFGGWNLKRFKVEAQTSAADGNLGAARKCLAAIREHVSQTRHSFRSTRQYHMGWPCIGSLHYSYLPSVDTFRL